MRESSPSKVQVRSTEAVGNPSAFQWGFLAPRYWLAWLGLGVLRGLSFLPMPALWAVGVVAGQMASYLPIRAQHSVTVNLALCFPEWDEAARRRLLRAQFRVLGQAFCCAGISLWGSKRRLERLVHFKNREYYDQALAQGQRVILLAPHFVVLEITGLRFSCERPMVSMYKSPKNPLFDWIMRRSRSRFGGVMIERDSEMRPMIRLLRQGWPFYYLPDQAPGGASHVFAPFFGVPTATITALSRIARMAQAQVIPCYTRLLPYGRGYEVIIKPPLKDFPSDDLAHDAAVMNAAVEEGVRLMPEQYLWTYKRFKLRQGDAPSYYAKKV